MSYLRSHAGIVKESLENLPEKFRENGNIRVRHVNLESIVARENKYSNVTRVRRSPTYGWIGDVELEYPDIELREKVTNIKGYTVVSVELDGVIYKDYAVCSRKDAFNRHRGIRMAAGRLIKRLNGE